MAMQQTLVAVEPDGGVKLLIGQEFFGDGFSPTDEISRFASYFEFHAIEVRELQFSRFKEANQIADLAIKTYQDVFDVVNILRDLPDSSRPAIRVQLRTRFPQDGEIAVNRAIDICLRWWLMLNLREDQFKGLGSGRPSFQWDDKTQLKQYVSELFPRSKWQLDRKTSRLSPEFTAAYMHKVCKLRVRWTSSLEDHLRLQIRDKTLWIFPYKACLVAWLRGRKDSKDVCATLLPREVLRETIRSLNLLFPVGAQADETEDFLREMGQSFQFIGPFESSSSLMDFDHWRDRLLDLQEMVFMNQPFTIRRFWHGLQDPEKFMNFWIALVLISGLTLISTIASIMQTVKAFQAL